MAFAVIQGFAMIPNEDVHHVLTVCGISTDVARQVFLLVEGLDLLD